VRHLLDVITQDEADALASAILTEMPFVNDELARLERCPPSARDLCYGPRILQATYGMRDDMVDLLADVAAAHNLMWPLT
jgi:hypothetical protein